jgi:hypothetical protein
MSLFYLAHINILVPRRFFYAMLAEAVIRYPKMTCGRSALSGESRIFPRSLSLPYEKALEAMPPRQDQCPNTEFTELFVALPRSLQAEAIANGSDLPPDSKRLDHTQFRCEASRRCGRTKDTERS